MARHHSQRNWFNILLDFVSANPKISAAIAFELGVLAAQATKGARSSVRTISRQGLAQGLAHAPARIIEALPGLSALQSGKAATTRQRRRNKKNRQAKARRRSARGRAMRAAQTRRARREAAATAA